MRRGFWKLEKNRKAHETPEQIRHFVWKSYMHPFLVLKNGIVETHGGDTW